MIRGAMPLALCVIVACDATVATGPAGAGQSPTVDVWPKYAFVAPYGVAAFTAMVTGTLSQSVTWSVQEGSPGGTVDSSGQYNAPGTLGTFHVVATQQASGISGKATVRVTTQPQPCANEPIRQTGTTYYVCDCQPGADPNCVAGNDSNSGTSPSSPWRTWSKAYDTFRTMAAGNTVALCKGGRWNGLPTPGSIFRNTNCQPTATGTCDLRDYVPPWASGDEGKPILNLSGGTWLLPMGWYNDWTNVARGIRVLNLDIVGPGSGTANTQAFYLHGGIEDAEFCGNTIRDYVMGALSGSTTGSLKRIVFHHNVLTDNPLGIGPIHISCDDCVVDSNYLDRNGGGTNRDHSMYIGSGMGCRPGDTCYGGYPLVSNMRVTNNEIYRSSRGEGSSCNGVILLFKNVMTGALIENNLIYEEPGSASGGCYGISGAGDSSQAQVLKQVTIRKNRVFNAGGAGIGSTSCEDCVVEANIVVGATVVGIGFPGGTSSGTTFITSTRSRVVNNTVYMLAGSEEGIRAGYSALEGTGHVLANNVVYAQAGAGFQCYELRGTADQYAAVANNDCYDTAKAPATDYWGIDPVTLPGSRLFQNPLFVNPGTNPAVANFTLQGTSPLIDAGSRAYYAPLAPGSTGWSATDVGTLRPQGAGPDIGAFER